MGNSIGHLATLKLGLATFHLEGDEFCRAFAIAHDGLRQFFCHAQHGGPERSPVNTVQRFNRRMRGLVGGDHHKGVIGRSVTIDRHPVERTLSQFCRQLLHHSLTDTGVGRHKAQHGGHIGPNHARAFADAGDAHQGATNQHLRSKCFGHGVGGHDALGGAQPIVFAHVCQRAVQPGLNPLNRQGFHDDTGGKGQHLGRRDAELARQGQTRAHGSDAPIFTRACIGIAGIDEQGPNAGTAGKMLPAQLHRRCTKPVLGEDTRHRSARIDQHHGQILALGFANAGFSHADAHAGDRIKLVRVRGRQIDRHTSLSNQDQMIQNSSQKMGRGNQPGPIDVARICLRPAYRGSVCTFCHCRKDTAHCDRHGERFRPEWSIFS